MVKSKIEMVVAAIAKIESSEKVFSCNALYNPIDSVSDRVIFEYTVFSLRNGIPYWWNKPGHKKEKIANLKAFKEYLISREF